MGGHHGLVENRAQLHIQPTMHVFGLAEDTTEAGEEHANFRHRGKRQESGKSANHYVTMPKDSI